MKDAVFLRGKRALSNVAYGRHLMPGLLSRQHQINHFALFSRLYFKHTPAIQRCMGMKDALRRAWKTWQLRGYIGKAQKIPISSKDAATVSFPDLTNHVMRAYSEADANANKKAQREEALREAFRLISLQHRQELRRIFDLDFKFFGYDPSPEFVFPASEGEKSLGSETYSYFDLEDNIYIDE